MVPVDTTGGEGACPAGDGLESVHDRYLIVIVVCWYFFVESFHSFLCRVACPEPLTCSALPFSESSVPYFSGSRQIMSYKQTYILAIRRESAGENRCFTDRTRGARSSLPRAEQSVLIFTSVIYFDVGDS